jgi:hypothetical protein
MLEHWTEYGPPPYLALARIAASLGVGSSDATRAPDKPSFEMADPFAVQSLIGQADVGSYVAPRRGLIN